MGDITAYQRIIDDCCVDIEKNNRRIEELSNMLEKVDKLMYEEEEFFYDKNKAYSYVQNIHSKAVSSLGDMLKEKISLSRQQSVFDAYEEIKGIIKKNLDHLIEENHELSYRSSYYQAEIEKTLEDDN